MTKQKMWLFAGIILSVLIISGSISYAFFTASITHNNQEAMVVEAGNMRLTYTDGTDNIALENALPGASATKTFSVENTGDVDTTYALYFTDLLNTFNDKTDLAYTLTSTEANVNKSQTQVPSISDTLVSDILISPNEIHHYTLTITFLNKNTNQNNNQGKIFNAKIGVNEMNYYPVADLIMGSDFNSELKKLANPTLTNVNLYTHDSYIYSISMANTLDKTKNYIDVATTSSPNPVYAWYDVVDDKGVIYLYTEAEKIYMNYTSAHMFANFNKLESIDLSMFDTSKVTNMIYMFYNCDSLTSLDLSNFDTLNVTSMSSMFYGCKSLTTLNLLSFNTSRVTSMYQMFSDCKALTTLNISSFDTSSVKSMEEMFYNSLNLTTLNVSHFDTSNVTSMKKMFSGLSHLTYLDVSGFDTLKVTNMSYMFYGMSSLTTLKMGGKFDTRNVTDMSYMFNNLSSLTSIDLNLLNTSNVTNMKMMFAYMSGLTTIDISPLDTSKVTDMSGMFAFMSNIENLDISSLDVYSLTTISGTTMSSDSSTSYTDGYGMFAYMTNLKTIKYPASWNTSSITNFAGLFESDTSLITLDLSNYNTSSATRMERMFNNCTNLEIIYVGSGWDTSKVTTSYRMFENNSKLKGGNNTGYSSDHIDVSYAHVDEPGNPGYFTLKTNT